MFDAGTLARRVARSARAASLLLGVPFALLAGCSWVSITYNNAPLLAVWGGDAYFSLTSAQAADLRARLDRRFAWHRVEQLPDYARFLEQLQTRIQGPIDDSDIAWLYAESRKRFHVVVDAVAPDAAALASTLRPEQIDRLERRFARNDQDFADADVNVPIEQARKRSIQDSLKSVEKWLGRLDEPQRKRLRALAAELPLDPRLTHEEYVRRHRELIELLRGGLAGGSESRRDLETGLRRIVGRWQEGQSAAHADFIGHQTAAYHRFFAEAANLATPAQREHATARLQHYLDELTALAGQSSARSAPAKQAVSGS